MQGDKIFLTFMQNSQIVAREPFKFNDTIESVLRTVGSKKFASLRRLFYKEQDLEFIPGRKTLREIGFNQNAIIELRNKYTREMLIAHKNAFEEMFPLDKCPFSNEDIDEMYPSKSPFVFNEKTPEGEIIKVIEKFPRLVSEVKKLTQGIIFAAVKNDGYSLRHIPKSFQTEKICCTAIMSKPSTIINVKIKLTSKIVETYLRYRITPFDCCDEIIKDFIPSQERLLEILKENGLVLKYIKNKTSEICLEAVTRNGLALAATPKELRTSEMCLTAIDNDPNALVVILGRDQTEQQCLLAVQHDPSTVKFVSIKNLTRQVWKTCLEKDPLALDSIRNQNEEICKFAFDLDSNSFKHARIRTPEFLRYVVTQKPSLISELQGKDNMLDYLAVESDPLVIGLVKNQTEDLILGALALNQDSLTGVTIQEEKYCYYAMAFNANAIRHVRNKTYEMCQIAICGGVVNANFLGEQLTLSIKGDPSTLRHMIEFQIEYLGLTDCNLAHLKTGLSCREARKQEELVQRKEYSTYADYILREQDIENLCLEAVNRDPTTLGYVVLPTPKITGVRWGF